jgi:O-antigen/teichoic acid export membrane protein
VSATAPPPSPALSRKIGGSAANFAIRRIALIGISAVGTLLVTRFIGPTRYGDYASAIATWTIVTAAADFGFSLVLARDLGANELDRPQLLRASYEVGLVWAAALTVVLVGIAALAGVHSTRGQALLVLAPSVLALGLATGRQVFVALYRTRELVFIDLVVILVQVVIQVIVAKAGGGAVLIAAIVSAGSAVNVLAVGIVGQRIVGRAPSGKRLRRELIRRSLPLGLMAIMAKVYLLIDLVILGWLVHGSRLGDYAAAAKMLTLAASVPALVTASALPGLASSADDREQLEELATRLWEWMLLLALPVVMVMLVFPEAVIHWTVGDAFHGAVPLLRILAASAVVGVLSNLFGTILIAKHIVRPLLWSNSIAIVLNVVANLVLVPIYGVSAAAWATVATEVFICCYTFIILRPHIALRSWWHTAIQPVIATAIGCALGWGLLRAGLAQEPAAVISLAFFVVASGCLRLLPARFQVRALRFGR